MLVKFWSFSCRLSFSLLLRFYCWTCWYIILLRHLDPRNSKPVKIYIIFLLRLELICRLFSQPKPIPFWYKALSLPNQTSYSGLSVTDLGMLLCFFVSTQPILIPWICGADLVFLFSCETCITKTTLVWCCSTTWFLYNEMML